jgi:cytochrome c biogenesis protein CcmG/thiol:disulfide interchange protein DsbE
MENKTLITPTPAAESPSRTRQLPTWVIVLAFVLLLAFLALIWWGLNHAQQGSVQINDSVPAFALTGFDGKQYATSDLAGKVIVVNFWASWCEPCKQEAVDMQSAWQYYQPGGKVVFMGVDWVDTEPEAKSYMSQFGITYLNGPDLRTAISQIFRIKGVPETYILDKTGHLKAVKIGPFSSLSEIRGMIDPLVN